MMRTLKELAACVFSNLRKNSAALLHPKHILYPKHSHWSHASGIMHPIAKLFRIIAKFYHSDL